MYIKEADYVFLNNKIQSSFNTKPILLRSNQGSLDDRFIDDPIHIYLMVDAPKDSLTRFIEVSLSMLSDKNIYRYTGDYTKSSKNNGFVQVYDTICSEQLGFFDTSSDSNEIEEAKPFFYTNLPHILVSGPLSIDQ